MRGNQAQLDALARELVDQKVDLIFVIGTTSTMAARRATTTIPIVSASMGDPVSTGLAASLARPGGNVTGLSNMSGDLDFKRLELIAEAVPRAKRIARLFHGSSTDIVRRIPLLKAAAAKIKRELVTIEVRDNNLDTAFANMTSQRVGAVMVPNDNLIATHTTRILALAEKYKLPTIFGIPAAPYDGGLLVYGPDQNLQYRRAAEFADRIFKGTMPGDIPIEQPMRFECVVNLKVAKALGIKLPPTIMIRATRVIE